MEFNESVNFGAVKAFSGWVTRHEMDPYEVSHAVHVGTLTSV